MLAVEISARLAQSVEGPAFNLEVVSYGVLMMHNKETQTLYHMP